MQANRLTAQTLERFFTALANRDAQGMAACYAYGARFEDPVFELQGHREIMGRWSLLFDHPAPAADVWTLSFHSLHTLHNRGNARWEPTFVHLPTGRVVHNIVYSQFNFDDDGLITLQRDNFDFWRWARQAYGFLGLMMGWTPLLWDQARTQAHISLQDRLARLYPPATMMASPLPTPPVE